MRHLIEALTGPRLKSGRIGIFEEERSVMEFKTGDILADDAEALVNTVNCVGVMGRGIALQFKNAFPENFKFYKQACDRHEVQPGRMLVFENKGLRSPRYIINFPTKRHWRGKSRMEDIDAGLQALVDEIRSRKIRSIAVPPLGSGLGGLDWAKVKPRIQRALANIEGLQAVVYEPNGAPDMGVANLRSVPKMTPGKAALIVLVDRYLRGLLDPFVTLLEVHKLMYFMQEAGQELRLRYVEGPYGPYADNLRHVLKQIEGHWISGYADGGDAPDKQLELVPGAIPDAKAALEADRESLKRFDRVADLVEGFETPFGLELLSTVHWIAKRHQPLSADQVITQTYAWNERKRQFAPEQIKLALRTLAAKGWIPELEQTKHQ
jgi:O-acetyl-ADP-ribose deacetylase (regulator of RNase III)